MLGTDTNDLVRAMQIIDSHNTVKELLNSKQGVRVKQLELEVTDTNDIVLGTVKIDEHGNSLMYWNGKL